MNFAHKIQNVSNDKYHCEKRRTWLEAFYNGDLIFAGLGLDSQEVVLRWMLIERRRQLLNINNNSTKAYYIKFNDGNEMSEEKRKFFDSLEIETLELKKGEKLSDVFAMINE